MRIYMDEFDRIFMTYDKILYRFKILNMRTKNGKEITHKHLRKAVSTMLKKHPTCRWRSEKARSKRYFILHEAYLWLIHVYFQSEKSLIDADIDFFEKRIKEYEKVLNVNSKTLWNEDMALLDLENYFHRKKDTIYRVILKMKKENIENDFTYFDNNKLIVTKEGVEWLCKNHFKRKYLEILEDYKMELTEKFIEAGFFYDTFFGAN